MKLRRPDASPIDRESWLEELNTYMDQLEDQYGDPVKLKADLQKEVQQKVSAFNAALKDKYATEVDVPYPTSEDEHKALYLKYGPTQLIWYKGELIAYLMETMEQAKNWNEHTLKDNVRTDPKFTKYNILKPLDTTYEQ